MKLENIGFYTLTDDRAKNVNLTSNLKRCELILTDVCNFKCPYCKGVRSDIKGTLKLEQAKYIVDLWTKEGLENIRFSGGEPTLYEGLIELVEYTKNKNVKRIALSTNGSANFELYKQLVDAGVNDFSISLDACCASFGEKMAGGIKGAWETVVNNIKKLSDLTYVTVGVVLNENNIENLNEIINFADNLGVADIRIIPSAQYDEMLYKAQNVNKNIINKHPILKYRVNNIKNNRHVRGIKQCDSRKCPLVIDDMVIAGNYHFPCIIYMREQGNPIGKISSNMRQERYNWMINHDCYNDPICQKNCLDVCIDYNNKYEYYQIEKINLLKIDSSYFDWLLWSSGSIKDFGIPSRYECITAIENKNILKEYAIGWTYGENLLCRPKEKHVAVMFEKEDKRFWFHIRNNEFVKIFQ